VKPDRKALVSWSSGKDSAWALHRIQSAGDPESIDHCGENGEFHTFVDPAPCFAESISCRVEGTVERDGFAFADLVPTT